jgi:hypothetical protein
MNQQNQYCKNGYITKAIYMFNAIPIKIPMIFFKEKKKVNPKVHMKTQRPQIDKTILSKKSNAWRYHNT